MLILNCNHFLLFRNLRMIKFDQLSTFNKATIMLLTGISLASLVIPYSMADTSVNSVKVVEPKANEAKANVKENVNVSVAEAPADADFKMLDVNSDKKISLKEAVKDKSLATSFDMSDMNKDGNITPDEYSSYKASTMKSLDGAAVAPTSAVTPAAPVTP